MEADIFILLKKPVTNHGKQKLQPILQPILIILLMGTALTNLWSRENEDTYPEITLFSHKRDSHFHQFATELEYFYQCAASGKTLPPPFFFSYRAREGDTLFTLAAALGLPYETLATFNRISKPGPLEPGKLLTFPTQPGLALPENPENDFEQLLLSTARKQKTAITLRLNNTQTFTFLPQAGLQPTERAFFLEVFFRFPLEEGLLSSGFGYRADPFTGDTHFHQGIDLAAPLGTPVLAAQEGKIADRGCNTILGNYIIIVHAGGYSTVYGHMAQVIAEKGDSVLRGGVIGYVGLTGRTTGPHLHFEIRRGDALQDPQRFLP